MSSMANGLMLGFRKIENFWIGMKLIQFIAGLEEVEMQKENSEMMELA